MTPGRGSATTIADMEFRGWITVPGIDIESDDAERLLTTLSESHGDLGPVLSGSAAGIEIVIATDAADETTAASELYTAAAGALSLAALGDHYPTAIELEAVAADTPR